MSDIIIELLKEEEENAKNFIELIKNKYGKLGGASLSKKKRFNQNYFYLHYRNNGKIECEYLGKLNKQELKDWKAKLKEAHCQKKRILILKKRIKFINKSLRYESIVR